MFRLRAARAAIVVACTLVFAVAAYVGTEQHTRAQNQTFLNEINESALRYVELTVESADKLLRTLGHEVALDCTAATLQEVRLHVYEHSAIKDLRVAAHDGAVRCSAYSETLEFDRDWPARPAMLATRNEELRIFRVQQFTSDALGVFRDINDASALVAIVGIDPMQLDVLPNALRGHGQVALEMANGEIIAANSSESQTLDTNVTTVVHASLRFPIRTVIRVETKALGQWNAPALAPVLAVASLLGALFGMLAARLVGRPVSTAQSLDHAIRLRQFRPYYQPIFSLRDRRILGCEVLMRWVLSDGRVLSPSAFIPLAESTGRIEAMTWQVLAVALKDLHSTLKSDPAFKVTFNAVPRHFLSEGFVVTLLRVATEGGASPRQIIVELTERDELEDRGRAQQVIRELREAGFRFALDDVGVGHSGLSHIQSLQPDILKIDKFFVDSLGVDMSANVVVEMLVRLAYEFNMGIVAEGIETETQLTVLRACGVSEGQGYLVSPPVALPAFLSLGIFPQHDKQVAAA